MVPPGTYYAVASRGLEYDLGFSPTFTIGANQAVDLDLQVVRSVIHSKPICDGGDSPASKRVQLVQAERQLLHILQDGAGQW